jgi:diguanylate cyclase (GGDEF)-like protein/PAS domain S-box-containing protein
MDAPYLSSGATATCLGVSATTLRQAVRRGEITPAFRSPGGRLRFGATAVAAYARRLADPSEPAHAVVAAAPLHHDQAQDALRAREAPYRRIVETAQEGILMLTPDGRIAFANEALADLLGYTVAELLDTSAASYILPEEIGALRARLAQRSAGLRESYDVTLVRKDGARVWAHTTNSPLRDDQGRYIGALGMISDISARTRAEEALRASEERFRALSEHANDLVAILDRAGVFCYVGPSYAPILGYAPAALEGHSAFDFAHPDDAPALAPGFAVFAVTPGATMRTEGRARHADGSWHTMEMVFHNRLDDPAIRGIIVNSHDVTARVQMQRDLEEGQQRYRSLFAHHPDAVFALGRDGALTSANAACAALTGYTVAELLTLSFPTLIAPKDMERGAKHFARAVAGEPQHDVALCLHRKDGDGRAVSVTAIPIVVDGVVVGVYSIAKDVTAHNAAQRALRHQATHDALTDLPNRAQLRDRLTRAWANGTPPALLLLDLDGFKEVNDTFGHAQGDALLREVADRLRGAVRRGDTVARLGGDEFAVALPGADTAGAERVASALRAALDAPVEVGGQAFQIGASVGIARAAADEAEAEMGTLLRQADVAMYTAKQGRLGQQVYDPALDTYNPERLGVIAALRAAIAGGALTLHYQPQADVASGRVCGVEALVRWPHPERGLIPPDEFIPLAEQTGVIGALTDWVLGEAIRQCAVWRRAGLTLAGSVNLSVWDLHDPALPDRIAALLRAHAVPPSSLRLEVTETTLMADPARALAVLTRLSALGVGLAVDDFGAGYSSLAYLKDLPVDELKIDKGFVRHLATDERDAAIVASTVGLGHALGLRVVAEGIEDRTTWDLLAGMGCDTAQGYYLARPLPAQEMEGWLRRTSSAWTPVSRASA